MVRCWEDTFDWNFLTTQRRRVGQNRTSFARAAGAATLRGSSWGTEWQSQTQILLQVLLCKWQTCVHIHHWQAEWLWCVWYLQEAYVRFNYLGIWDITWVLTELQACVYGEQHTESKNYLQETVSSVYLSSSYRHGNDRSEAKYLANHLARCCVLWDWYRWLRQEGKKMHRPLDKWSRHFARSSQIMLWLYPMGVALFPVGAENRKNVIGIPFPLSSTKQKEAGGAHPKCSIKNQLATMSITPCSLIHIPSRNAHFEPLVLMGVACIVKDGVVNVRMEGSQGWTEPWM